MERKRGAEKVITYTCYSDGTVTVERENNVHKDELKSAEFIGYGFATGILLELATKLDVEVERSGDYVWSVLYRRDTIRQLAGDVADLFDCPSNEVVEAWDQFMEYLQDKYIQCGTGTLTRVKSFDNLKQEVLEFAMYSLKAFMGEQEESDKACDETDESENSTTTDSFLDMLRMVCGESEHIVVEPCNIVKKDSKHEDKEKKNDNDKTWAETHIAESVPSDLVAGIVEMLVRHGGGQITVGKCGSGKDVCNRAVQTNLDKCLNSGNHSTRNNSKATKSAPKNNYGVQPKRKHNKNNKHN